MRLEDWIDRRHLEPAAQVAYLAAFAASPHSAIIIDNLLQPERLGALQRVFATEGRFETRHYAWKPSANPAEKSEIEVPTSVWRAAPASQRASIESVFAGAHPAYRLGDGILSHLKFTELLRSPEFMDFLQAATGIRPATLTGFVTRIMVGGQYIQPHSDFWRIRDLCGVYYASTGWQPGFGGRFRHCGPGPDLVPIDPLPNRLLLFEPRAECKHDVEPIVEAGASWQRWAFSLWFGTPAPPEP